MPRRGRSSAARGRRPASREYARARSGNAAVAGGHMSSGHQVESRAPLLDLSAEELLTTCRAVRKRLDFDRPVPHEVLRECVAVALQAPSGSNRWGMQFVIVTDPGQRRALGELYRASYEIYRSQPGVYIGSIDKGDPALNAQQQRTTQSADFLRSEEHTSELQSRQYLVCRLLLEKKNTNSTGQTDVDHATQYTRA